MNLTVVGCGKMGLPIAVQASSRGLSVIGVDTNERIVKSINAGKSPINEPGIQPLLKRAVKKGLLRATTNIRAAVSKSDAIIVIVPVVLDDKKRADLKTIISVTSDISRTMRRGAIVSFETTLPVGTTRNTILPILERSGLEIEKDFYLIYSPERVKSNTVIEQMRKVPKVVGAAGPESLKKGLNLYRSILTARVVSVGALENAEMVKLAGMAYRDVNIALSNELAKYCDMVGINLKEILSITNTDGEANLLFPGIGVGGHCTPVYPYFLINDARRMGTPQVLAEAARKVNDGQAEYAIDCLASVLGGLKGVKVLILGLGFRPGVKEDIESPAYLIKKAIAQHGGKAFLYDPLYAPSEIAEKGFEYKKLRSRDRMGAVILVTAHEDFLNLDWKDLRRRGVKAFVDGRNVFKKDAVEKAGIQYIGIGTAGGYLI